MEFLFNFILIKLIQMKRSHQRRESKKNMSSSSTTQGLETFYTEDSLERKETFKVEEK